MASQPTQVSRKRANSASTTQSDKPDSIFSDFDDLDPSPVLSSATSLMSDDIAIVDKKEFEANAKRRKLNDNSSALKIIKGSTFGGADPLHALLKSSGIEPLHWREERQRRQEDAKYAQSSRKRPKSTPSARYLKPERYENLPLSPQDYLTSGLDLYLGPETRERFWKKVKKGWKAGCKRESVVARRKRFTRL